MQCGVNYSAARVTGCCCQETVIILKQAICATSFLCLAILHNEIPALDIADTSTAEYRHVLYSVLLWRASLISRCQ